LKSKVFLFSGDNFFNLIFEEQFSALPNYNLVISANISNIINFGHFKKNDVAIFYSVKQEQVTKIKRLLSDVSYSPPAIIIGSSEDVLTLEKNSFIFLKPPFSFNELLKIIENINIQRDIIDYSNLKFKKIILDMTGKVIKGLNNSVKLTDKEARIIWHLIQAKGDTISQDFLLNKVWGYNKDIETKTLTTHIYTIRKKIIPFKNILSIESSENGYYIK
jgi:DNA-binding response OmpR family regulator